MNWVKHAPTESKLKEIGVKYQWSTIPFSQLNVTKSLKNNARLTTPLDEDVVLSYALAAEKPGACFPGPVFHKNRKGYDLNDGNHRMQAMLLMWGKAKRGETVSGYELLTDDKSLLDLATRALNRTNGLAQTKAEALQQAIAVLELHPGMSQRAVASTFNLDESAVSKARRVCELRNRLRPHRVNPDVISQSAVLELSRLEESEPAMIAAASIVAERKLGVAQTNELVSRMKKRKSDAERLAAAEEFETELDRFNSRAPGQKKSNAKANFYRCLHGLFGIVAKHPTMEHLHITSKTEIASAREDWKRLRGAMDKVFA